MNGAETVHATCVALSGRGVLLRGPPGSGKSDLALRLIDGGAVLVADDQVALRRRAGSVIAAPPPPLAGLMEVRGIGPVAIPYLVEAALALVVDLVEPSAVARLPEGPARRCTLLGVPLDRLALAAFEASAPAKVRLAVARAKGHSRAESRRLA